MALALKGEATVMSQARNIISSWTMRLGWRQRRCSIAAFSTSPSQIVTGSGTAASSDALDGAQALLYGATRANHATLGLDDCGGLLRGGGMDIMTPLYDAVAGSLKFAEPGSGEAKPEAAAGEEEAAWEWEKVLDQYLEAGGTTESFLRETPKTTLATIRAYHRRRGWIAWQTAVLQRGEFKDGFPSLQELMGTEPVAVPQSPVDLVHAIGLWGAALARKR
jgi:hypothetical protein